MHRFYLPKENFFGDYVVSADQQLINQLAKVLRLKEGERVTVFNGDGREYVCQLTELNKNQFKLLIIDERLGTREPDRFAVLYLSLLKSDKFEWILQKVTELGVSRIVPVVSEHCVVREISEAKFKRYQEIIKEASEQCGGSRLPDLSPAVNFKNAIESAQKEEGEKYIAWEKSIEPKFAVLGDETEPVHIFVGPEGGYSENEIEFASSHGFKPISLGKRILRAETASIVAVARII